MITKRLIIMMAMYLSNFSIHAESVPISLPQDNRIKVVHYDPNQVIELNTSFGYATTIEFGDELIKTVATGDSTGWKITPSENRLFIRPESAETSIKSTNLTVITDKRNYYFHIKYGNRQTPTFILRFDYRPLVKKIIPVSSSKETTQLKFTQTSSQSQSEKVVQLESNKIAQPKPDEKTYLKQHESIEKKPSIDQTTVTTTKNTLLESNEFKEKSLTFDKNQKSGFIFNHHYKISKNSKIKVDTIYDDGKFTYLKFGKNQPVPLVYFVDDNGKEQVLELSRRENGFYSTPQIAKRFTLRYGLNITCIINDELLNPEKYQQQKIVDEKVKIPKKRITRKKSQKNK